MEVVYITIAGTFIAGIYGFILHKKQNKKQK